MSLYDDIINLQLKRHRQVITLQGQGELAYKYGHRDSRRAAAELANNYEHEVVYKLRIALQIIMEGGSVGYLKNIALEALESFK